MDDTLYIDETSIENLWTLKEYEEVLRQCIFYFFWKIGFLSSSLVFVVDE
jgi:hypothetical protein